MTILDDFREAAVPSLREVAKVQAFFAVLDIIDLEEARAVVTAEARKVGSALLPPREQDRLIDWIANLVWDEAKKARERVLSLRSRGDSAEKTAPARYYDGLAARCSQPEAMRWTFAAISPAYRKHLNRERRNAKRA